MALVGTKYSFITRPTITSMSIDMAEVGKRAMYMLIDLMNHELRDKINHFDAQLVTRNSTLHELAK
jgi:DNA-binding LacI/PurR family transcriptional regulator